MSEENIGGEHVIIEEKQRLVGFIDEAGNVCLEQQALDPAATQAIYFDPGDVDAVIHALTDLQQTARAGSV